MVERFFAFFPRHESCWQERRASQESRREAVVPPYYRHTGGVASPWGDGSAGVSSDGGLVLQVPDHSSLARCFLNEKGKT